MLHRNIVQGLPDASAVIMVTDGSSTFPAFRNSDTCTWYLHPLLHQKSLVIVITLTYMPIYGGSRNLPVSVESGGRGRLACA